MLWYLGQGSEARVRLRAPAHNVNGLLVVPNEATIQTKLVHLQKVCAHR